MTQLEQFLTFMVVVSWVLHIIEGQWSKEISSHMKRIGDWQIGELKMIRKLNDRVMELEELAGVPYGGLYDAEDDE